MPKAKTLESSRPAGSRLFQSGRDQPVGPPPESESLTEELVTYPDGSHRIPGAEERSPSLAEVLSRLVPLDDEIGSVDDPPAQPEEIL